jgi:hypothetical protein
MMISNYQQEILLFGEQNPNRDTAAGSVGPCAFPASVPAALPPFFVPSLELQCVSGKARRYLALHPEGQSSDI